MCRVSGLDAACEVLLELSPQSAWSLSPGWVLDVDVGDDDHLEEPDVRVTVVGRCTGCFAVAASAEMACDLVAACSSCPPSVSHDRGSHLCDGLSVVV